LSAPGEKLVLTAHEGEGIEDVAFSPDGTRLVTEGLATGAIRIWNAMTGQELLVIEESDICCSAAFSPDGTFLITSSASGNPGIWDAATGKQVALLPGNVESIGRSVFSPDGTHIAIASSGDDGSVQLWESASDKQLISIPVHNIGWVNDIAFSPDGKLLATSSTDIFVTNGTVEVWDVATGERLFVLADDSSATTTPQGLAFSPDGKRLAVGYSDNVAKIWDVSTHQPQSQPSLVLRGHSVLVWRVAFSPDGARLATASQDGTVKLWNVGPGQGQEATTLPGHTADVSGIAFSPDGKYLASVSYDGTLRIYFTQIEDLIAFAKTRVTRTLTIEECQKYLHLDVCPVQ
jgi:WD40 repeat protein